MYDRVADLPLTVEDWTLTGFERDTTSDFVRASTVIELHGAGETGRGEDVTYETEDHEILQREGIKLPTGEFTFAEYSAALDDVVEVSERDTSKTWCVCGREDDNQRVERGLYVCEECDAAFNADVNGAENIRLELNQSNSESPASLGGDRSTGWLAQPGVYLYDLSRGFQPRAAVVDCKP